MAKNAPVSPTHHENWLTHINFSVLKRARCARYGVSRWDFLKILNFPVEPLVFFHQKDKGLFFIFLISHIPRFVNHGFFTEAGLKQYRTLSEVSDVLW
jgi:hypothetical protein